MSGPLLETKLFVPKPRAQLVSRRRLLTRLDRAITSRLTLVSAPPGFGKTTLLADWYATAHPQTACIAWVTLDPQDNQASTFWRYVVKALQRVSGGVASQAEALLESQPSTPVETVLSTMINELSASQDEMVLLLDDYHIIDNREIQDGMAFLLDHLPQHLHLVLASRADPPLPLARLRTRGELVELRAADLRFQPDEAESYLNDVMDLSLTDTDLEALGGRTEGWIAALQLAALSLQGRDDASSFIEDFAGDNRYIVDYLVEEVLEQQSPEVRTFLLQTSILDRLSGELCDAVTGQTDSQATLRYLEDANVFLVALDERRRWYRYHHLFAEVLRARLRSEHSELTGELHIRASRWFQRNDDAPSAVRHALAASDSGRAAGLIELSALSLLRNRQETAVRSWLEALPDEVVRSRPVLNVLYAGALMNSGEFTLVENRLRDAEQRMERATLTDLEAPLQPYTAAYVDQTQFRELPGMIALYRAGHAQVSGNLQDTEAYARKALEVMPEEAPLRGGAMALLGLALWSKGELEAAYQVYSEGIALTHRGGYVNDSSVLMLADIRVTQGRLREALSAYPQALQGAGEMGVAAPRGVADLHVGISEIYREQGDLALATEHLARSRELGELAGLPEMKYRWFTAMAGVKQAQEDFGEALELLLQAERLYGGGFSPDVRPISAMRARVWIKQGRLDEAFAWARDSGLTADDELSYLREFEHVTLARLLLARGEHDPAMKLLTRLLVAAEAGGRIGAIIEILVLLSIAQSTAGDRGVAVEMLKRALALGEPEGHARTFLDEGTPIKVLLETCAKQGDASAHRLLAAIEFPAAPIAERHVEGHDTLSERELEVVRLLRSDLSGPDIARELVVSLNTMRTHTKSIYAKLGVNSRRAAIRRAEELHLL